MKKFFKRILAYFFQGLLIILPIFFTIYIFYLIYQQVNFLYHLIVHKLEFATIAHIPIWVYVIIDIFIIFLIGYLGSAYFTKKIFVWFENIIYKLPIVRIVYGALQGLTSAFVGNDRKLDHPVLVKINNTDLERIGFLVQGNLHKLHLPDKVAVYLPNSYGITGNLIIVKSENVRPLQMEGLDAMSFAISGGLMDLHTIKIKKIHNSE